VLANDHKTVLGALIGAARRPLILEEVAASAGLPFERTWYAVLELIELQYMTPAGAGLYCLTDEGEKSARQLTASR